MSFRDSVDCVGDFTLHFCFANHAKLLLLLLVAECKPLDDSEMSLFAFHVLTAKCPVSLLITLCKLCLLLYRLWLRDFQVYSIILVISTYIGFFVSESINLQLFRNNVT